MSINRDTGNTPVTVALELFGTSLQSHCRNFTLQRKALLHTARDAHETYIKMYAVRGEICMHVSSTWTRPTMKNKTPTLHISHAFSIITIIVFISIGFRYFTWLFSKSLTIYYSSDWNDKTKLSETQHWIQWRVEVELRLGISIYAISPTSTFVHSVVPWMTEWANILYAVYS